MRKPNDLQPVLNGLHEHLHKALEKYHKKHSKDWYYNSKYESHEKYWEAHLFFSHWNKLVDAHMKMPLIKRDAIHRDYWKTYNL